METWAQSSQVNPCKVLIDFQSLKSLELYGLYESEDSLLARITQILCRCQYLETLGLGKAHKPFLNNSYSYRNPVDTRDGFLEKLCTRYSLRIGFKPLELKTLRLGWGMFPGPPRGACQNYLAKLTDPTKLRTFHVWNGHIANDLA